MRTEIQQWHMETLSAYNQLMFDTLIYDYNISTDTLKEIEFENDEGMPCKPIRGYFAVKDKRKYWIEEQFLDKLPLRMGDSFEELKHKEDLVHRPLKPKTFRITPNKEYPVRQFIDNFLPFKHSNEKHWTLLKFISLAGFIGRVYCCISSFSEFGKSSVYDVLHYLTDKSPVFKPRSVPGVLCKINGVGNIVFDETHRCKKDIRDIIEEFALQIGGGKALYINGALKSSKTKMRYDCSLQSITFLYNNNSNYDDPLKDYFEFIFSNNVAIDSRFLKFKLDGKLTEEFSKDFDVPGLAEQYKMEYVKIAKQLFYLQELKKSNGYERRFVTKGKLNLKGRKLITFSEITWLVDMYSETQEEYDVWIDDLEQSIIGYKSMVTELRGVNPQLVEELVR